MITMIKIIYKSHEFVPIVSIPGQINLVSGTSNHYFKGGQLIFRVVVTEIDERVFGYV